VWQLPLGRQGGLHVHRDGGCVLGTFGSRGLTVAVGDPRKVKRLPSCLEGPGFWLGAMVGSKVQPERLGVMCESQERVLVVYW